MRAAIYCRVSTEEQAKNGQSLEAQESLCREYAEQFNYEVVHVGIEGISAKDTDHRPELLAVLELVARKQIQHLMVTKSCRLSRETIDSLTIAKKLAKKGVTLHLVTDGGKVDFDDPTAEAMFGIKSVLSKLERKRISLHTKLVAGQRRKKGLRISRHAPYGFMFQGDNVIENPSEQAVIRRIQELHAQGYSERKISRKLATEGLYNRAGNEFTRGTIRLFLKAA